MTPECKADNHKKCSGTVTTYRGNREILAPDPKNPKKKIKVKVPADRLEGPHDYDPCDCSHHKKKPKKKALVEASKETKDE